MHHSTRRELEAQKFRAPYLPASLPDHCVGQETQSRAHGSATKAWQHVNYLGILDDLEDLVVALVCRLAVGDGDHLHSCIGTTELKSGCMQACVVCKAVPPECSLQPWTVPQVSIHMDSRRATELREVLLTKVPKSAGKQANGCSGAHQQRLGQLALLDGRIQHRL